MESQPVTDPALEALAQRLTTLEAQLVSAPHQQSDYDTWDWSKRNIELAVEHDTDAIKVSQLRRILGKPKVTKWSNLDVSGWDWNMPTAELARQHRVPISVVDKYRWILKKPSPPRLRSPKPRWSGGKLPSVDWAALDWEKPDILLCKELCCSRELVRQKRAQLGKPKRKVYEMRYESFVAAIGKKKVATAADIKAIGVSQPTGLRYLRRAGILYKRIPSRTVKHAWHLMDWRLPNLLLGDIWDMRTCNVSVYRHTHCGRRPLFKSQKGRVPPQWHDAVAAQKDAAAAWRLEKMAGGQPDWCI